MICLKPANFLFWLKRRNGMVGWPTFISEVVKNVYAVVANVN